MKTIRINIYALILSILAMGVVFWVSLHMVEIDTDITGYLPQNDPVISDAGYIFENHPIHDRLIIDMGLDRDDPDRLVHYAAVVEERLKKSGLFRKVGTGEVQDLIPDLISHILDNLPLMFTDKDLNQKVRPLLKKERIIKRVEFLRSELMGLQGIGQSRFISRDPLGLKDIVLARLSHLAPVKGVEILRGRIISPDRKHLMLTATPLASGTDTAFARKISGLIREVSDELQKRSAENGDRVTITPMGAYRAALDNEALIRGDVQRAILLAMAGIALLLIFAFPRPLLGLFAFLPALAGTVAAFFFFSLIHRSISIMTLGFGGAVISITVDHAIAFLLFLDRPTTTSGREASREIWAVGLLAALTTMGAFGTLCFCDFPVFEQIGLFTALGIAFSFIYVHTVFPLIFPSMPPAPPKALPLRNIVAALSSWGKRGAFAALIFGLGMIFFANPGFNVQLSAMNSVREETVEAEELLSGVWGDDIFQKTYLMTEGKSREDLQREGDRLLEIMDQDVASGVISSGFVPSMIFPGRERGKEALGAWKKFWDRQRISDLKTALAQASHETGFAKGAFGPFFRTLSSDLSHQTLIQIPRKFDGLLGITEKRDGSAWVQVLSLTPGGSYDPEAFYQRYRSMGKIFDPSFFSLRMGDLLFSTFSKILLIVGISVALLLFLFFLDLRLTLVSILPLIFALISTLGTLNLMGHPIDIPGLMLSIVVIGMGVDYSIFLTRSYQRYGDDSHPSFALIRMAVFMASASTMVGFGALCFARHSMLRSAGLTSLAGIGYALMGAFLILPPLLRYLLKVREEGTTRPEKIRDRVLRRYRNLEPYPRVFARFKLMIDPMFKELPRFLESRPAMETIIDVGTGYGVPACWLLERFPGATVYGVEPDRERVRVASRAVGERGVVIEGRAPDMPPAPGPTDGAFMLDMTHFITDTELDLVLKRLGRTLRPGGYLMIRSIIPPEKRPSLLWRIQAVSVKIRSTRCFYRPVHKMAGMIEEAGFRLKSCTPSGSNEESVWFIAEAVS
ncbi:MAG: MMPL family transporter [Deltaproteobacteria bacterium]|nr:MMPL family transporter [Deltaproteobacteria bacterium]